MANAAKTERVEFLDGLRGWGAVVVFAYHLVQRFLADGHPWLSPGWAGFLLDGPFAVYVFFVISGFALSHANLDPSNRDLQMAATSRYFRLAIPIFATTFLGYLLLKGGFLVNVQVSEDTGISRDWLGTFYTFDASIYEFVKFSLFNAFFSYQPWSSYNSSLWTIPHEFLGSVAVFGYLSVFRARGPSHVVFALGAFLVCLKAAPIYACFFGGYLIAEAKAMDRLTRDWRTIFELVSALGFYSIVFVMTLHRPDGLGALAFLATCLVACVAYSSPLKYCFSARISVFLGKISFPLYLVHIFVICSWSSILYSWLPSTGMAVNTQLIFNILSTAALSGIAAVLLLPVERFSVKTSKRIASVLLRRSH